MKRIPVVLILFFLFSCSGDKNPPVGSITDSDSTHIRKDSAQVFLLPTPLQVATLIRQYCPEAELELLSPDTFTASHYETNYYRALNLGICLTDVGYCAFYSDRQSALNYLERAESLIRALHLDNITSAQTGRIRDNISQPDSLSHIILSLYNEMQKQLNETGKEKIAFYISSGSYLEGLAITLGHKNLQKQEVFSSLLYQQKLWLDQQAQAVTFLDNDNETQDLYNTFFTLQHYFKPGKTKDRKLTLPAEELSALSAKAVQLRNEAVKGLLY
jgi:hypothetical protein